MWRGVAAFVGGWLAGCDFCGPWSGRDVELWRVYFVLGAEWEVTPAPLTFPTNIDKEDVPTVVARWVRLWGRPGTTARAVPGVWMGYREWCGTAINR
jgi:hypothetical protein